MLYMLAAIDSFSISDSVVLSLLGILVGFTCLCALMMLVYLLRFVVGKFESAKTKSTVNNSLTFKESFEVSASVQNTAGMVPAKGSIGEINLHDVDDKTAALLIAIVADEIKAPLNELRFISIREVES